MISVISGDTVLYPVVGTAELRDRLNAWYEAGRLSELTPYAERAHRMEDAPISIPDTIEQPPPRLNTLYWPIFGMARYAYAVFLMSGDAVAELQAASSAAVTIAYQDAPDASDAPRTFPMYYIADRPVSGPDDPVYPDLYYVIFCDQRYYWQNTTGIQFPMNIYSWTQVFDYLVAQLPDHPVFTITDAPLTAYSNPSYFWSPDYLTGRSTLWLLDAAAALVGSRIIFTPTAFALQRPTETNLDVALAAYDTYAVAGSDPRYAGGGLLAEADWAASIPATAQIIYPQQDGQTPPFEVDVSTGGSGPGNITAWLDIPSSNPLSAAADQWTADWFEWQFTPYDVTWAGFVAPPDSAFLSAIEICHDESWTKAYRPPLGYSPLYQGWPLFFSSGQAPCNCFPSIIGSGSSSGGSSTTESSIFDGNDVPGVYDTFCDDGVLMVYRGQMGLAYDPEGQRGRLYWYNIEETAEGCCQCSGGPLSSGSSGGIASSPGISSGGTGNCNSACPGCPNGTTLQWSFNVPTPAPVDWICSLPLPTFTSGVLNWAPSAQYPCQWTASKSSSVTGPGACSACPAGVPSYFGVTVLSVGSCSLLTPGYKTLSWRSGCTYVWTEPTHGLEVWTLNITSTNTGTLVATYNGTVVYSATLSALNDTINICNLGEEFPTHTETTSCGLTITNPYTAGTIINGGSTTTLLETWNLIWTGAVWRLIYSQNGFPVAVWSIASGWNCLGVNVMPLETSTCDTMWTPATLSSLGGGPCGSPPPPPPPPPVSVPCCPSTTVPTTLYVTWGSPAAAYSGPVYYTGTIGGISTWQGTPITSTCGTSYNTVTCNAIGDIWQVSLTNSAPDGSLNGGSAALTASCSPFLLSGTCDLSGSKAGCVVSQPPGSTSVMVTP